MLLNHNKRPEIGNTTNTIQQSINDTILLCMKHMDRDPQNGYLAVLFRKSS